jgi:hypothetical protein
MDELDNSAFTDNEAGDWVEDQLDERDPGEDLGMPVFPNGKDTRT